VTNLGSIQVSRESFRTAHSGMYRECEPASSAKAAQSDSKRSGPLHLYFASAGLPRARKACALERELSRELELPWIKDRSRGAESGQGALDAVLVVFGNRADEVRCEVDGKNFVHIWPVEQIESVHRQLQPVAFADVDHARKADIHGTKAIATVGIARRETDSVGHRVAIVIGVESDEDCERPRRLHGDDTAEFEVSQE